MSDDKLLIFHLPRDWGCNFLMPTSFGQFGRQDVLFFPFLVLNDDGYNSVNQRFVYLHALDFLWVYKKLAFRFIPYTPVLSCHLILSSYFY